MGKASPAKRQKLDEAAELQQLAARLCSTAARSLTLETFKQVQPFLVLRTISSCPWDMLQKGTVPTEVLGAILKHLLVPNVHQAALMFGAVHKAELPARPIARAVLEVLPLLTQHLAMVSPSTSGATAASSKGGEAEKDAEVLVAAADAEEDAEAVKKEEEEVEKKQNTGSEREQEDQRHSGASSVASTASIRLRHQHAPGFRDRAVPDFLCSRRLSAPDSSNSGEEHLVHTLCLDAKSDSKMVDWDTNVRFQVGSYVADLALFNLREYKYARPCVGIASNISTNGVVGIEPQTVVTIDGQGKLTVTDDKCKDQAEAAYEDWKKRFRQMYMHVPDDGTEVRLPPGDYVLGPCYYMPQTKACLASLDLPLVNSAYVLPAGPYQFLQIMLLAGAGEKVKKITVADVDAAVERWQEERLCISRLHTPAADFNWVF